ncbi:hypothetical protein F8388_024739 [Cannabis sativa]|uniref:Protein FAR1-RELATED SEQUENCE n=1 Tax=Cannabis sativa TaxID=3483 RepID=A0A7J6GBV6_CANSA|nr:hypothetical protein F8388_024739 [Cannabis sativa]
MAIPPELAGAIPLIDKFQVEDFQKVTRSSLNRSFHRPSVFSSSSYSVSPRIKIQFIPSQYNTLKLPACSDSFRTFYRFSPLNDHDEEDAENCSFDEAVELFNKRECYRVIDFAKLSNHVLCSLRETPLDVIVVTSDNAMQYQRTSFLIPDNIKGLSPGSMFLAMSNGLMIPRALLTCNFMWIMNIDTNNEEQHSNNQRNEENQEATNDYAIKIMQIHSNIPDDEIPKVSMEFETEEQAYNFYNVYAYKVGFSIRRSKMLRMFEVEFSKAYSCAMELITESYTHIVTRASVTEKAYKLARDGFKRISDDVDACLEEDTVGRKEENCTDGGINTTIKGIKTNNKRIRGSSSTRPKNALEKMR